MAFASDNDAILQDLLLQGVPLEDAWDALQQATRGNNTMQKPAAAELPAAQARSASPTPRKAGGKAGSSPARAAASKPSPRRASAERRAAATVERQVEQQVSSLYTAPPVVEQAVPQRSPSVSKSAVPKPKTKAKAAARAASKPKSTTSTLDGEAPSKVSAAKDEEKKPEEKKPEVAAPWGKVYTQEAGPGVASYHFATENEAFLSYDFANENDKSNMMDDGRPYPKQKTFEKGTWELATRTFRATIDYGARLKHGASRFEYEMIFSTDYMSIMSGSIKGYHQRTRPETTVKYSKNKITGDPRGWVHYFRDMSAENQREKGKARLGLKDPKDLSPETVRIMGIMNQVFQNANKANGGRRPAPGETMGNLFGKAMQEYARDIEAEKRINRGGRR